MSIDSESERIWYALDVTIEPIAREAVQYGLMEAGALGTEVAEEKDDSLCVGAYFDARPGREQVRGALFDALRVYGLPSSSVRNMVLREVANRDWLGEWKKSWQPTRVGERFIVAPPWTDIPESEGRIIIRIEPGMAFGTGTHETTRLCLAAIEKYFSGESFLDIGTGTGILAIAAAKLFPAARVEACDTDVEAIEIARENAALNDESERISFRVGTIAETSASANMVCANLTADVILSLLPELVGATCGRLILSGVLDSQTELVVSGLNRLGITEPLEIATEGEWVAVVV